LNRTAKLRVLVSSTSEDLRDYRAVARNVILDLDWHPRMMEHFGASSQVTVEACRREVEECELVLLFVSFRRGWVPSAAEGGNGKDSITALELAHARSLKKPVLAMLTSETWPGNLWEDDGDARSWVKQFRAGLNLPAEFFDHEPVTSGENERQLPGFRAKVRQLLVGHQERLLRERPAEGKSTTGLEYFRSACDDLYEGRSIPFISSGIYGTGPLSPRALAQDLLTDAVAEGLVTDAELDGQSLATCAEYCERLSGSREAFLQKFNKIVRQQEAQATPLPVYTLLASIPQPPLIVCATFDRLLDQTFAAAGRTYVTISHVLRSADGRHDGEVLVLRPGTAPEFCLADKVSVADTDAVVYRPFGAPSLHEKVDPKFKLDTVVVTESDHVAFLRRLENQSTGIPEQLRVALGRRPLLFLGYALDVWQYRLMMQVFQPAGPRETVSVPRAVRVVGGAMEEIVWKRLSADVIRLDPNEFATRAAERARHADGDTPHA
jgi:Domain of unknown function (DUF4062)/SIR2-like domain